jgi:hypothetical protein
MTAWLIGVAGGEVDNVFKPHSCELRFDRRHGGRRTLLGKTFRKPMTRDTLGLKSAGSECESDLDARNAVAPGRARMRIAARWGMVGGSFKTRCVRGRVVLLRVRSETFGGVLKKKQALPRSRFGAALTQKTAVNDLQTSDSGSAP